MCSGIKSCPYCCPRIGQALEKKRARIAARYAAANTFQAVAEEWLVKCERDGLAPVTVDKIHWLLAKAYPLIGAIPIAQITPHEALAVLRAVEATGAYESARRMRSVLSRVFRYGVATVRCEKDVAADLRGAIVVPKVKHFAAITRPSEVGALLRAIDGYTGHRVTVMAMRLSPHVLLRYGELRQAEWSDIDVDEAIWFVPAERMKMRRPHRVPLSPRRSRNGMAISSALAPAPALIAVGFGMECRLLGAAASDAGWGQHGSLWGLPRNLVQGATCCI